jgi:hypothetical protein
VSASEYEGKRVLGNERIEDESECSWKERRVKKKNKKKGREERASFLVMNNHNSGCHRRNQEWM